MQLCILQESRFDKDEDIVVYSLKSTHICSSINMYVYVHKYTK